jgi:hypothetical protein
MALLVLLFCDVRRKLAHRLKLIILRHHAHRLSYLLN